MMMMAASANTLLSFLVTDFVPKASRMPATVAMVTEQMLVTTRHPHEFFSPVISPLRIVVWLGLRLPITHSKLVPSHRCFCSPSGGTEGAASPLGPLLGDQAPEDVGLEKSDQPDHRPARH